MLPRMYSFASFASLIFCSIPAFATSVGGSEAVQGSDSGARSSEVNSPFINQGSRIPEDVSNGILELPSKQGLRRTPFQDYRRLDNLDLEVLPVLPREKWGCEPNNAEKQKGFVVFSRPWANFVFPESVPNNRIDALEATASCGEYVPITLAIHALQDLGKVSLRVGDLVDKKTQSGLKSSCFDIRTPRYFPYFSDPKRGEYTMIPKVLERTESESLKQGSSLQYWITAYVPKDAGPGTYTGSIAIKVSGKEAQSIPLTVTVLPIDLKEADSSRGMCFLVPPDPQMFPGFLDVYFKDMKDHGLNCSWMWPIASMTYKDGELTCDFTKSPPPEFLVEGRPYFSHSLGEMLASYTKTGYERPWVYGSLDSVDLYLTKNFGLKPYTPEYDKAFLSYVGRLRDFVKENKYPPFHLLVSDEPGHQDARMKYSKYYLALIKDRFPDQSTFLDCGPWQKEDELLAENLNVACYTDYGPQREAFCKAHDIEQWSYLQGSGGLNGYIDRFYYGLGGHKAGLKGIFQWVYLWTYDYKINSGEGNKYVYPSQDGPVPTIAWEALRQGVIDARYLATLRAAIEGGLNGKNPAVQQKARNTEKALEEKLSVIPSARSARRDFLNGTPTTWFDEMRKWMQDAILDLQNADKEQASGKTGKSNPAAVFWENEQGAVFDNSAESLLSLPLSEPLQSSNFRYNIVATFSRIPSEGSNIGGQGFDWYLSLGPDRFLTFAVFGPPWVEISSSPMRLNLGQEYSIVAEVSDGFMRLHVDGALLDSAPLMAGSRLLREALRLSGYAWEAPDAKGYFDKRAALIGSVKLCSLSFAKKTD